MRNFHLGNSFVVHVFVVVFFYNLLSCTSAVMLTGFVVSLFFWTCKLCSFSGQKHLHKIYHRSYDNAYCSHLFKPPFLSNILFFSLFCITIYHPSQFCLLLVLFVKQFSLWCFNEIKSTFNGKHKCYKQKHLVKHKQPSIFRFLNIVRSSMAKMFFV